MKDSYTQRMQAKMQRISNFGPHTILTTIAVLDYWHPSSKVMQSLTDHQCFQWCLIQVFVHKIDVSLYTA